MKVLVISDLHADVEALTIALAKGRDLGCSIVLCAGDLVDGAYFPDELIAILASRAIPTVRGNHDRWALEAGSVLSDNYISPSTTTTSPHPERRS